MPPFLSPMTSHPVIDERIDRFHREGYLHCKNAVPIDALEAWRSFAETWFRHTFEELHARGWIDSETPHHIPTKDRNTRKYTLGKGAKNGFREIVMRNPGRYELSLEDTDPALALISKASNHETYPKIPTTESLLSSDLRELVARLLQEDKWEDCFQCNYSLIYSTPGALEQTWHSDSGHLNLDEHWKCHVLNIFIPLTDVALDMGPTEIRPGSHYLTRNLAPMMLAAKCRKTLQAPVIPTLRQGDTLIFDYRILHRGLANKTPDTTRVYLVVAMSKPFFRDLVNFPRRSLYHAPRKYQELKVGCRSPPHGEQGDILPTTSNPHEPSATSHGRE